MTFLRSLRLPAAVAAACCLAPLARAGVEIAPAALLQPGQPWARELQVQQTRFLEAQAKARFQERLASVPRTAKAAQEGWDAVFYDLTLDLDPTTRVLTGTTALEARVTGADVAAIELDLMGIMAVSAVRVGGLPAAFSRPGDLVAVTLDRPYQTGEIFRVEVDYAGNPAGEYYGWSSYGGQPLIWTLSEPYGARWWWPCKDVNTDKADSVSLHVTVPDPLIVASNGVLTGQSVPAAGRTTFHWTTRHPIATYLVSLAVHPYVVVSDTYTRLDGGTMPVDNYLIPAWEAVATAGYAVVPQQIAAFAAAFGEYPFADEKYGHAHFPWGGGMEHQTCSSMTYTYYQPWFLAHELAHQWWGDMITCADFHHIWLNEGFATWCEAYWREVSEGVPGYIAEMQAAAYYGPGTIYVTDASDFNRIFDGNLSYNKGSWVVHMLRGVMGDADFFAGLLQFRAAYAYGSATTEELQAVMESVSGLDLGPFFQQWVYGQYYPAYEVSWDVAPAPGGSRVTVRVAQTQTATGLFTMPLDIRVTNALGDQTRVRVQNSLQTEWYVVDVPGDAVLVELDPDSWVLCTKTAAGVSGAPELPAAVSASAITGAAPNPSNPRTEIRFAVAEAGAVRLTIHDAAGRRVRTLVDGVRGAGAQAAAWDGRDDSGRAAAAGVYFVRFEAGTTRDVRKISLVK